MPTPTVSIHVPMFERNAPVQKAAKTLCRNGAKGLVDRLGAGECGTAGVWQSSRSSAFEVLGTRDEDRHDDDLGMGRPVPAERRDLVGAAPSGGRPHQVEGARPQRGDGRVVAERL